MVMTLKKEIDSAYASMGGYSFLANDADIWMVSNPITVLNLDQYFDLGLSLEMGVNVAATGNLEFWGGWGATNRNTFTPQVKLLGIVDATLQGTAWPGTTISFPLPTLRHPGHDYFWLRMVNKTGYALPSGEGVHFVWSKLTMVDE